MGYIIPYLVGPTVEELRDPSNINHFHSKSLLINQRQIARHVQPEAKLQSQCHPVTTASALSLRAHLIDNDVVRINLELRELLHQPLRLVEGQELRDANAHERGLVRVLELVVDLVNDLLQLQQLAEHVVLGGL